MNTRLDRELALLYRAEAWFGVPAAPIVHQLVAAANYPLPDLLPPPPPWLSFQWPVGNSVNLQAYWREVDEGRIQRWAGPFV